MLKIKCKQTGEVFLAVPCYAYMPEVKYTDGTIMCRAFTSPFIISGYYVNSSSGGNMNRGWCKVFAPDSVEIIND